MNTIENQVPERKEPRSAWLTPVAAFVVLGIVGLTAALVQQHSELVSARLEIGAVKRDADSLRQSVAGTETLIRQKFDQEFATLAEELSSARKQTEQHVIQARSAARKQAEIVASRLAKHQEEQRQIVEAELNQLKSSNEQTSAKLTDIGSEVGEVKTQAASTRSDLDKTVADLRRMTGDMGVMSGLIATNSSELAALKALGERDYFEFTLSKTQARQRLGGVSVLYKKADPKRNRFTIEIVADDKRVEKKDRTVNEPVQFYVPTRSRLPFELVVNAVTKDTLVGYVSVPKTQIAQR